MSCFKKHRILTAFLTFVLFLSAAMIPIAAGAEAEKVVEISTRAEFEALATPSESGTIYKLTANLDFSDAPYAPFAVENIVLDGGGHTIGGLTFAPNAAESRYALFSVATNAEIKNLTVSGSVSIENSAESGYSLSELSVAGFVGAAYTCKFTNCVSEIDLNLTCAEKLPVYFGGIAAAANGDTVFENCKNTGTVVITAGGVVNAGGIAGSIVRSALNLKMQFSDCENNADLTVNNNAEDASKILNLGGIIGEYRAGSGDAAELSACKNSGNLTATWESGANVGGVLGGGEQIWLTDCRNTAAVSATCRVSANAGGIVGVMEGGGIVNSFNRGKITTASLTRDAAAGGIAAKLQKSKLYNDYSIAPVKASNTGSSGGGLSGLAGGTSFYNCYVSGKAEGVTSSVIANASQDCDFRFVYYDRDACGVGQSVNGVEEKTAEQLKQLAGTLSANAAAKNGKNDIGYLLRSFATGTEENGFFPVFSDVVIDNPTWADAALGYAKDSGKAESGKDYEISVTQKKISVHTALGLGYLAAQYRQERNVFSGYALTLTRELDLSKYLWTEWGFGGTVDGGGYMIRGLRIGSAAEPASFDGGLFSVYSGMSVKNLGVSGEIYSESSFSGGIAAICQSYGGVFENVFADVKIVTTMSAGSMASGGLIGQISYPAQINNSFATGSIALTCKDGQEYDTVAVGGIVGGISGMLATLRITNSYSSVALSAASLAYGGSGIYAGGIGGYSLTANLPYSADNVFFNASASVTINGVEKQASADGGTADAVVGIEGLSAAQIGGSGENDLAAKLNLYIDGQANTSWTKFKISEKTPYFDVFGFTAELKKSESGDALIADASGKWAYRYAWFYKDETGQWQRLEAANSSEYQPDKIGTYSYRAEISNYFESVTTDSIVMTVNPPVPPAEEQEFPLWAYIAIGVGAVALVTLVLVLTLRKKKYILKYVVDGDVYESVKLKTGAPIEIPADLKNCLWFMDEEFQKRVAPTVMPGQNLTLYTTVDYGEYRADSEEPPETTAVKEAYRAAERVRAERKKEVKQREAGGERFREMMSHVPQKPGDGKKRYSDIGFDEMMSLVPEKETEIRFSVKSAGRQNAAQEENQDLSGYEAAREAEYADSTNENAYRAADQARFQSRGDDNEDQAPAMSEEYTEEYRVQGGEEMPETDAAGADYGYERQPYQAAEPSYTEPQPGYGQSYGNADQGSEYGYSPSRNTDTEPGAQPLYDEGEQEPQDQTQTYSYAEPQEYSSAGYGGENAEYAMKSGYQPQTPERDAQSVYGGEDSQSVPYAGEQAASYQEENGGEAYLAGNDGQPQEAAAYTLYDGEEEAAEQPAQTAEPEKSAAQENFGGWGNDFGSDDFGGGFDMFSFSENEDPFKK